MIIKKKIPNMRLAGTSLLLMLTFVFSACSDLNFDDTAGVGQVNFHMTDAAETSKAVVSGDAETANKPVEGVEEVNIDVQALRVHFTETANDTVEAQGKWVDIQIEPVKINLLELSNADTLIAEAELEAGFYSQVRLILGDDSDIVVNGETHPLTVPSGQQSGYKIKLDERLHSGEEIDLSIEFDSDKSIHVTGNDRFMLKPVLRVFNGRENGNG